MRKLRDGLTVRLSPGDRQRIETAAAICGVPISKFVRECAVILSEKTIQEYKKEAS